MNAALQITLDEGRTRLVTHADDATPGTAPNTRGWAVGVHHDQDIDCSRPAISVPHHHLLTWL